MKASAFASALRDQMVQLSIDGRKTLETNNVALFLDQQIPKLQVTDETNAKIDVEFKVAYYKARLEEGTALLESALDYGKNALNAAMLINAGASVALLSFIGSLSSGRSVLGVAPRFSFPLLLFVLGVLFAALAFGCAYCTQYFYSRNPNVVSKGAKTFHRATVVATALAYLSFVSGGFSCYRLLSTWGAGQ